MALERIEQIDHELHAFVTVDRVMTLQQAAESEAWYRNGDPRPLEGVPVSVKDAFHLQGLPTTLGSLHHQHDIAADDSGVVKRLRGAGVVFTGKTNTAEFGQSATTDNLLGPDTGNPWDLTRTSGGSSGGAAASVACRACRRSPSAPTAAAPSASPQRSVAVRPETHPWAVPRRGWFPCDDRLRQPWPAGMASSRCSPHAGSTRRP